MLGLHLVTKRARVPLRSRSGPYFSGMSAGAPSFLTRNAKILAGLVLLAFRPTTWTSFVISRDSELPMLVSSSSGHVPDSSLSCSVTASERDAPSGPCNGVAFRFALLVCFSRKPAQ